MESNKFTESKLQDEKLLEPYKYISQLSNRTIQIKVMKAFNIWLKIPDDKMEIIGDIGDMAMNAALLFDDIQDNSIVRRGIPVAQSIYGIARTINAATQAIFIAAEKVLSLQHPDATKIYLEELIEHFKGQGIEIYWRDNCICPSEEEYKQMAMRKSGVLFTFMVRFMKLFSDNKSDFVKLAGILGQYMQILNDYYNFDKNENSEGSNYCDDITEGKFSLPIIHAIHSQPNEDKIMQILRQRTKDIEVKKYCVSLLEKYGSLKYTRDTIDSLDKQVREEIQKLGGNPYMEKILDELILKTSSCGFCY